MMQPFPSSRLASGELPAVGSRGISIARKRGGRRRVNGHRGRPRRILRSGSGSTRRGRTCPRSRDSAQADHGAIPCSPGWRKPPPCSRRRIAGCGPRRPPQSPRGRQRPGCRTISTWFRGSSTPPAATCPRRLERPARPFRAGPTTDCRGSTRWPWSLSAGSTAASSNTTCTSRRRPIEASRPSR